jgi:predicted RNA-binding protein YlxR (DUF448 family)
VPRRTCVGCGRVAAKADLLRLAAALDQSGASVVVVDRGGKLPGRGAYMCRDGASLQPSARCLALARRRRSIVRALRTGGMARAGAGSNERDPGAPLRHGGPTLRDARAIDCEPLESVGL